MTDYPLLHSLFLKQCENRTTHSEIELSVLLLLRHDSVDIDALIEEFRWKETISSCEVAISNWKRLLELSLLSYFVGEHSDSLSLKIRQLEKQPWNQNSQQFRLLISLNHLLTKMPTPDVVPNLLESGAATIDISEYTPWLSLPYSPDHLEFGIFFALLTQLTQKQQFKEQLLKITRWQLNTLKDNFLPFSSLYSAERSGSPFHQLIVSYLLFYASASLTKDPLFTQAAFQIEKHIGSQALEKQISPLWVLLERAFIPPNPITNNNLKLSQKIYDPSSALVGHRTADHYAISTLHGGYTGLGCVGIHDVEIINYGPQYFPLDDCRGFGIEGNYLSDHGMRKSIIETTKDGFKIKGCTRFVDQPQSAPSPIQQMGNFKGIWLELAQEFKQSHLKIDLGLLGISSWENIAFSFFVKAEHCQINENKTLKKNSFEKYNGQASTIQLLGKECRIELSAKSFFDRLEVIPLEGCNSFWGANFLIAYVLDTNHSQYSWNINLLT